MQNSLNPYWLLSGVALYLLRFTGFTGLRHNPADNHHSLDLQAENKSSLHGHLRVWACISTNVIRAEQATCVLQAVVCLYVYRMMLAQDTVLEYKYERTLLFLAFFTASSYSKNLPYIANTSQFLSHRPIHVNMGGNESKLEQEWQTKNDGSGSFWDNVKRGAVQGAKEFGANPGKL